MKSVAVDAMGGDRAPGAVVEGAVLAARDLHIPIVLVGPRDRIDRELAKHDATRLPITVVAASEVVTMDDGALEAVRRKPDSSMRRALELVQSGESAAFVSAGNSGAVMALASLVCRNVEGIDRPAIALEVPSERRPVLLLDAGANVDCSPINLVQFAVMGEVASRCLRGVRNPRIGLISNGEERTKGTEATRIADEALQQLPLRYVGYVEGRDIAAGRVDVAVTDGFTGNAILKTLEGFGSYMQSVLRDLFSKNWRTKLAYRLVRSDLAAVNESLDYASVGGARLLGVQANAIIAHGSSSPWAVRNAIRVASEAATKGVDQQIHDAIAALPQIAAARPQSLRRLRIWKQLKERFLPEAKNEKETSDEEPVRSTDPGTGAKLNGVAQPDVEPPAAPASVSDPAKTSPN